MIRRLEEKDYYRFNELVIQLHEYHVEQRPDLYSHSDNEFPIEIYKQLITKQDKICLGYEENNKLLGICYGKITFTAGNKCIKVALLSGIVVDSYARKQKIASKLIREFESIAKQSNAERIDLTVACFNDSAICLYESLGFTPSRILYEKKI